MVLWLPQFAVGGTPTGIVFDGKFVWVANDSSNSITKIRPSDAACVGACGGLVSEGMNGPLGMAFDGANLWVANNLGGTVTKF